MCQPEERAKFSSPESVKHRKDQNLCRVQAEYNRKYREVSDTEKNESEDYSEELVSKNMDSSIADSVDVIQELGLKKRNRRGKFGSFAQVVNFMGKTAKRN